MSPVRNHVILSGADRRVLDAVRRFHFVTAEQTTRFLYGRGSLTYARSRLKRLSDAGYLHRLYLPRAARSGGSPAVYTLTRRGTSAVRGPGDPSRGVRPSEQDRHGSLFLDHTLAVNEVLIAAHHLAGRIPWIRLADCRHERDLRRQPARVAVDDHRTIAVIPDGFLDFRIRDRLQMCMALELDRSTVEARAFRRKVAALLGFAYGPYPSIFGTSSLTITFVVDGDERRLVNVISWTEQELRRRGKEHCADLFRFTQLPAGGVDPLELFCAPRWHRPFQRQLVPLLVPSLASPAG